MNFNYLKITMNINLYDMNSNTKKYIFLNINENLILFITEKN